jgi:predicted alpha/beta superfamily hydrolase
VIELFPIFMTPFNQDRLIRVYLPKNYNTTVKNYPVMYMHDGQNLFHDTDAIGGVSLNLEKYLDELELEVIVVGIDQNPAERINEYCPWENGVYSKKLIGESQQPGGKGKDYVDFIVRELKPFIDNRYRTKHDHTAMGGISLGGLISTYAACKYPHIFKNIAIFSSGFYRNQEEIEACILKSDLSTVESFYLDCGKREVANNEWLCQEVLDSNIAVYSLLKEKVENIRFEAIPEAEHHYRYFKERVSALFAWI